MKEHFEILLKKTPLIAILRGITPSEVAGVCDILFEAGIFLLEIPLNSPNAFASIKIAAEHSRGRQLVGAGTVLTPEDVRRVQESGGCFIISPNTDIEVIRETKKCGMLSMPGFFTASEAFTALKAGADYLKLFPASGWRASHGRGGRLSLGVGCSHRVPSADQGQAWDKNHPLGRQRGSRRPRAEFS